ncbi:MAG: amino acid adenylation domain-containing protein [Acidobacteriota bacterium]
MQYADFAAWQRERLSGEALDAELAWWRERLAGAPPVLDLPSDRPRPAVRTSRGTTLSSLLPAELAQELGRLGQRHGATLFMTLLAGFAALLSRYADRDDILVGSPVANRRRVELEGLIGFFVNTLVLRLGLSGPPSFSRLVEQAREVVREALQHQDLPFERLVEDLEPRRDLSHAPVVQVLFQLEEEEPRAIAIPGLELRPLSLTSGVARADLTVSATRGAGGLAIAAEASSDLFEPATVARLLEHFGNLLAGAAGDPELPVGDLPLLGAEERRQILEEWSRTAEAPPDARPVHERVAAAARANPGALAVELGGERLTYGELDGRADRLAARLRRAGVGVESRVAVHVERGPEMAVAFLAVLKAGGAYVPLDPEQPGERLALMIEDAGADVLLTSRAAPSVLTAGQVVFLDEAGDGPPPGETPPEALAYLIFTSGSTGRPKGVAVPHSALSNLVQWHLEAFGVTPADRVAQVAGLGFDASVWEIWPCLAAGASLHLVPGEIRTAPEAVRRWLVAERITVAFLPTPLAEAVLALPDPEWGSLRVLLTGGDRLRLPAPAPAAPALVNNYGPTENAVVATSGVVAPGSPAGSLPPIGRPVSRVRAHVLDRRGLPVPALVAGELWLGGASLARGYFGRPDLTAERFLPDPFGEGGRLYRTGDLVRWRRDGGLEYLGRADQQVKVRGVRIEPGEIEAALAAHPAVREAVVVAGEDLAGDRRLVAYVAAEASSAGELRSFLGARLPAAMVPSAFVFLDRLPLTPNGKVDRRALPAPEGSGEAERYVAPGTSVEELLAGIWSEILSVARVGAGDDFFALGGHSLLATRVVSAVRRTFGVELPLRALFEAPILADLARRVEAALRDGTEAATPALRPVPRDGTLPLSFSQERLWFVDQLQPGTAVYNLPVFFRVDGRLSARLLEAVLSEVVRRHEVLRTRFEAVDGAPRQRIEPARPFPVPVADLSGLVAEARSSELARLAGEEARRPFDLQEGRLLRVVLVDLGEEQAVLFNLHHIAGDGWSMGVLTREVVALYGAFRAGKPSPLAEPAVQYADFAAWQRQWLSGPALERQVAYWRERLAGVPAVLDLPVDRPRPPAQDFRGGRLTLRLPREFSEALRDQGRREGVTLFMLLLAAFEALLSRHTRQDMLAVGTPIANRHREETEGLIGFFVNTLALTGDLRGDPTWRELLARSREASLGAYAHQDLPFEKLVEELEPQRDLSTSPLFQVMLVLQNTPREALELPGLRLEPLESDTGTAKFDLTLTVHDDGESLAASLNYRTGLFETATARRLLERFEWLLAGAAASPEARVRALPLLSREERAQLLVSWNATATETTRRDACLHELISAQAARTPEAVAVRCEDRALSYRELEREAGRLALYLRGLGVGPEVPVGLLMEQSLEGIVGLLGILQAGGAYVPLDPEAPAERLAAIVEDAGLSLVVTRGAAREVPLAGSRTIRLDELPEGDGTPESLSSPSNLAYVLYTSGSTGRPKGVMVEHRSVVNYSLAIVEKLGLGPGASFAQVQPLTVDSCVTAIFPPLLSGGSVHTVTRQRALDAGALCEILGRHPADGMKIAPSHLSALLAAAPEGPLLPRRWLVVGGEPSQLAWLRRLRAEAPERAVFNHYGPTEATVGMLMYPVEELPEPGFSQAAPVGRPLANCQGYLLDSELAPVPPGTLGQLYIGGDCVARGYLGRPDLTAERFLPDPYAAEPGGRLYDSGDLMRHTAEGDLVFFGRLDHQVKIRGFRIELGEIEAAVARHPGVREAVVRVWEEAPGRNGLVAYVVTREGAAAVDARELRRFLADRLPDVMLPSAVVALADLPRTPHGKLDLKALPAPLPAEGEAENAAPRTPAEERMAGIWSAVLARAPIGIHDNFFESGGHSLLAIQLVAQVRQAFGVDLPLRTLFEAPTVAELAAKVAVARAGRSAEETVLDLPTILPDRGYRHEPFPLNEVQQAYWVGRSQAFELGNSSTYSYTELESEDLDLDRLEWVINRLIERHSMLRAIVLPTGEQQILERVPPFRIPVEDLRGLTAGEAEARLAALRQGLAQQVLPADRWPLFDLRATLLPGGRIRLHLGRDALIWDAWSFRILRRDLAALYRDPDADLPVLDLSFRDYVLAERALESTALYQRSRGYWTDRLPTLPPAPELPLARPPGSLASPRFVRRAGMMEPERWSRLKSRGHQLGLTPSGLVLAAFSEVLAAWSRSPRLTINLTLFRRLPMHPEVDELIGDFTSLTLLEVDAARGGSFELRARAVQERLWDDLDHPYFSGLKVLRELVRLRGGAPGDVLMPVVLTSTLTMPANDTPAAPAAGGLAVEGGYSISRTSQVWLDHQVSEARGALRFNWDAVEDLFPPGLLDDMFGAYCRLLERLADGEEAWQATSLGLPPTAQEELRARVNATAEPLSDALLHTLVSARAAAQPDHPAVVSGDRVLSYAQLERLSTRLGRRLRELGARPNELVAVVMEKGWKQAVAVLAVLKSGAAYLPLDPALPPERLRFLLEQGEARLALTQPWLLESLSWPSGVKPIAVEAGAEEGEPEPLTPVQGPRDLAYVIFTSGSTGVPKGVMIEHEGAVNTVLDVNRRFGIGPEDRVLALSSLSFDLSVWDLFGVLAAGGTVVMPDPSGLRDPEHWAERMERWGVTLWNTVPALMEMLTEYTSGRASPGSLRLVLLSGDWIALDLPDRVRHLWPGAEVISLGGATEASIWSILYPIGEVEPDWKSIPYGRPMVNQTFHVLDERLESRPVWVPGDLFIGGVGLARGYWRDAEKTKRSFAVHPRTGERLYRTGDKGRWLPDGTIEFLGREDTQVKIQGYRVELGEIEAALESHPEVRSAVVSAVGPERGARRLVAYVVPRGGEAPELEAVRSFLRAALPEYMVPAALIVLPGLPLTANGKVDRKALPVPELASQEPEDASSVPRTAVEERLVELWKSLLGIDQVGIHDSLFQLGGNSLTSIQLLVRVREAYGVDVPLRSLFEEPTVAGLAAQVDRLRAAGEGEAPAVGTDIPAVAPDPEALHLSFPLNDVQQAYWIGRSNAFDLGNVASHGYLELEFADLDVARFERAFRRLIRHHPMLRALVTPDGQQRILETVPPYRVEVLDLAGCAGPEAAPRLAEVRETLSHQILPVGSWPLFDVRASRLPGGRVRLHCSVDILLVDAWSSLLLFRQMGQLYADPAAPLPPCDLSFRDYILAEIAFKESAIYRRSREYWLQRLESLPPAPDLPLSRTPGSLDQPRFTRRHAGLGAERWSRLKGRAAEAGLTPSGVLLAAFSEVLAAWSRSPRFSLNITTFSRLPFHPHVNEIVGDFTSLTLLEVDASGDRPFRTRARAIQEQLWKDLEHRFFSGIRALREIARHRGRGSGALMPVVFTSTLFGAERRSGEEPADPAQIRGEVAYAISQTPQVYLDHQVSETRGALRFNWDSVEELFPAGLLDDLFGAYCRLLERLADGEEAWQAASLGLPPTAQEELRARANATAEPHSGTLLHTLVSARAAAQPDWPAVVSGERVVSYGELERLSTRLGRQLRELGARPNELVAVVMEKGWEQAAAVLAVLKSGAAYLPIDPSLPPERLRFLLEQGEARLALTQPRRLASVEWPEGVKALAVEGVEDGGPEEPLEPVQGPRDLAYVIFTSGSTGVPKGVMIEHEGAVNTVLDVNRRFGVGPEDRVLALSSLSFDLSVWDLFGVLAAGGTVVMPDPSGLRDPEHWTERMERWGVTLWNTVPALMEMLTQYAADRARPGNLRLALLSGDWIALDLPERVRRLWPGAEVISLGGATEASIWSILYPIGEVEAGWKSIPYGLPMVNQTFQVLDERLEPRPVWVPGDLYIGGAGLARGYWRDAEKTERSFVFQPRTGERLYRTGDKGRWLGDGTIEFLGREDTQVKIQGYRVELGEIEAALESHPEVRSAVVSAVGPERGARRLVAYVVPQRTVAAPPVAAPAPRLDSYVDILEFKLSEPGLRRDPGSSVLQLDEPAADETLARIYATRRSHRRFLEQPISRTSLGHLLSALRQVNMEGVPLPKYRYPSAGNLYPVQVYLYVKPGRIEGVPGGSYYYHPKDHRLVLLREGAWIERGVYGANNQPVFDQSAFAVFLVGRMSAITPVYGDLARDFCLLEAGYVSQLLMSAAPEHELGLCPIGTVDFERVRASFGLEESHVFLHGHVGGRIEPDRAPVRISLPIASGAGVSLPVAPETVPAGSEEWSQVLRTALRGRLPDYMVPAVFMTLETLPLTSNGKVDRRALPLPEQIGGEVERVYTPPGSPIERTLAGIWAELLRVERVGIHDNFFELGGDSVLGIQVISRAAQAGLTISTRQLFGNQTIAELAPLITAAGGLGDAGALDPELSAGDLEELIAEFGGLEPEQG